MVTLPPCADRAVLLVVNEVSLGTPLQDSKGQGSGDCICLEDDFKCGKAALCSLGFGGVEQDCLQGLGSRKHGPPAGKPNTHLSRGRQGQDFSGQRCSGGWV